MSIEPTGAPAPAPIPEPSTRTGVICEGQVLAGRYRIGPLIGRGGMGSVYEAHHLSLGTAIAIKVISPQLADTELARTRFVREARAAAALQGAHVVQILDYGVHEGTPYIAMERLEGEALSALLQREGPLPPQTLLAVVEQVARALTRAHAAGIVHRDLKPDNVFVRHDEDGVHCKVLDFGIAKAPLHAATAQETHSGAMLGTPYYMSPEQARDAADAGPQSDLWSLGVIAYEGLVGTRPFDAQSVASLSVQILVDPIPVPSEHALVPDGFDAWFSRATARDRDERFSSARQMARALAAVVGADPTDRAPTTITAGSPARTQEPGTRRRGRASALAVGTAVVGLGLWWTLSPAGRPDRAQTPHDKATGTLDRDSPGPAPSVRRSAPASPHPAAAADSSRKSPRRAPPTRSEPAPVAPPDQVQVQVQGPAGARVYLGETLLGQLPGPVMVPRGEHPVTLRFVARGYADLRWELTPNQDAKTTVTMVRRRRSPQGRRDPATEPPIFNVDDLEL